MSKNRQALRMRAHARFQSDVSRRTGLPKSIKVGDLVFFKGWRHLFKRERVKPRFGFVEHIDGAYHLVRPRWAPKERLIELYPGEISVVRRGRTYFGRWKNAENR